MSASFLVAPPVVIKSVTGGARQNFSSGSGNVNSLDLLLKNTESTNQIDWDLLPTTGSTYYNAATLMTST